MTDNDFILPAGWPLSDEERAIGYTRELSMPTDKRRISIIVDDDVFTALALDPVEHGATPVSAALARYAEHVGRASRRVEKVLAREEWNALADVLNGSADLWDWSPRPMSHLLLIRAEVEDGHRLDGLGYKWFGDGKPGDAGIKALLTKLGKLTEIEGDAVAAAVRHFWYDATHGNTINHMVDEWWTLAYRTRKHEVPA